MATLTPHSTSETSSFDRLECAVADTVAGRDTYPDGTVFVESGHPFLGALLREHSDAHRPVVIVYPDGRDKCIAAVERHSAAVQLLLRSLSRTLRRLSPSP